MKKEQQLFSDTFSALPCKEAGVGGVVLAVLTIYDVVKLQTITKSI